MKTFLIFLCAFSSLSFCPVTEKDDNKSHSGFYIVVSDHTDRTNHKYIVEEKDSLKNIVRTFLNSELELGDIDRPISIYNGKQDVYIARVTVIEKPNGKKDFRHLKYPPVYTNPSKTNKRSKLTPVTL